MALPMGAFGQSGPLRKADVLSAKTRLESMIVQRYSLELSTIVDRNHFRVGARIEINSSNEKQRAQTTNQRPFTDLDLGYLNADELFDRYAITPQGAVDPLEKYTIRSVNIQVGLKDNMGEETKKTVDQWLSSRVKSEFGSIGKAQVQFIKNPIEAPAPLPPPKEVPQKTLVDQLKELQDLAGHMVMALSILLGVLLFKILSGSGAKKGEAGPPISINNKLEGGGAGAGEGAEPGAGGVIAAAGLDMDSDPTLLGKIDQLSGQIRELAPKMLGEVRNVINEWCEQGEDGLMQIACFAEISGSVLGSLPIPQEFKQKMGDTFAKMHDLPNEKKYQLVNKTYWDLVASLNLGTESLHRPFSFVGKAPLGTVNKVLLGNDVDIQTIVSLYMPEGMRRGYFANLERSKKVELLNAAAKLSDISKDSLSEMEEKIAPYFGEEVDESKVSLSLTLSKLIDTMDLVEAIRVLPKVEGPVIEQFKMTNPHIAFLEQWSPGPLEMILKKANNEELMAYARIVPDMADFMLELVSPRTKKILADDLARPDRMPDSEKEAYISSLHDKLVKMVQKGEIALDEAIQSIGYTSDEDFAA